MKKIVYFFILNFLFFPSCDDFLQRDQFDAISSFAYFKQEKDLELYSNGFLNKMMPDYGSVAYGDDTSDYISNQRLSAFLSGGWNADRQGGWSWGNLRNINYFLDNMSSVDADEKVLKHYEGVGRFWRAKFYFDMVKTFGDVPYYDHVVPTNDIDLLYKGRDSREYVMSKVLEDLSFAAENCLSEDKYVASQNVINKWVALSYKSRVCLFEGTYRKYHDELELGHTATMWLNEAADAAKELIEKSPYRLANDGNVETQYRELFISEGLNSKEVILGINYELAIRQHYVTKNYYNLTAVGEHWGMDKRMVNTYLLRNGDRFTDKPNFETVLFQDEFKNRDLRLKQTLRHPGYTRTIAGRPNIPVPPTPKTATTCYQFIKHSLDDDYYDSYESHNDLPVIRYAEILLNYAEAKAELNDFDENIWNITIKPLRERAGVNGKAPLSSDPYLVDFYMNQTNDKWILEIRRERSIELIMEGFRYDDLMRWSLGDMLLGNWYGIYVPELYKYIDLDGDGKNDIYVSDKSIPGNERTPGVDYIIPGEGSYIGLSNGDHGYLEVLNERTWDKKYYLRPIPRSAIIINQNLSQNPGW